MNKGVTAKYVSLKTQWTQFTGSLPGSPRLGNSDVGAGLPNIISAGDGSLLSMGVALIRGTVTCRLPPVFKGFFFGGGIDFIERLLLE